MYLSVFLGFSWPRTIDVRMMSFSARYASVAKIRRMSCGAMLQDLRRCRATVGRENEKMRSPFFSGSMASMFCTRVGTLTTRPLFFPFIIEAGTFKRSMAIASGSAMFHSKFKSSLMRSPVAVPSANRARSSSGSRLSISLRSLRVRYIWRYQYRIISQRALMAPGCSNNVVGALNITCVIGSSAPL